MDDRITGYARCVRKESGDAGVRVSRPRSRVVIPILTGSL